MQSEYKRKGVKVMLGIVGVVNGLVATVMALVNGIWSGGLNLAGLNLSSLSVGSFGSLLNGLNLNSILGSGLGSGLGL